MSSEMQVSATRRPTVYAAEELMGLYFPIHDHGFIGLKDYMGSDDSIEAAARGSYAYGTRVKTDQRNLLRYMMRQRHTSPTEQVEVVVHAAMPIFVARQWIRHRTASVSEMSGRYSLMPMLFYTPVAEHIQAQSKTNKQGRGGVLPIGIAEEFQDELTGLRTQAAAMYDWATENDIARELARIDLPNSIYTQWFWKIDLHNLFHALSLRCDEHAQWETRQYFCWLAGLAKRLAPISFEAWEDYHFYAKTFSRQEMTIIRRILCQNEPFDEHMMAELTRTERDEFMVKLNDLEPINFDIDMSLGKEPSFFEEKFRKAAEGR